MPGQTSALVKINSIEITGPEGTTEKRPVKENRIYIGYSRFRTDKAIEIRHVPDLQKEEEWIVAGKADIGRCRLTNIGQKELRFQPSLDAGVIPFRPQEDLEVSYGRAIKINDHMFVFHRKELAESIEIDLHLPDNELTKKHIHIGKEPALEGSITLRHNGTHAKPQFDVIPKIEGVSREAYFVDSPHPTLINTLTRQVKLIVCHPKDGPVAAGDYLISVYVKSSEYGEEVAADFSVLHVAPFHDHRLEFIDEPASGSALGGSL